MAFSVRPRLTSLWPVLLAGLLLGTTCAFGAGVGSPPVSPHPARGIELLELEINPESRVKVARIGTLPALVQGQWQRCLIRVLNAAGTTAPLRVEEASSSSTGSPAADFRTESGISWRLEPDSRMGMCLTGASEEYRVLSFRASTPGRRLLGLRFNIGQGTQDLGFRGEADLLFNVVPLGLPLATAGPSRVVEPQPLLAHSGRVREALELLGAPLSPARIALLERAGRETDAAAAVERVQAALDPLCLADLQIRPDGTLSVTRAQSPPTLQEQGWRTFLVKVRNAAGATGSLRVTSPNAQQVPNGPAAEVGRRWLDLHVADAAPLSAPLSGMALEYRILQVYARDAGPLAATLSFNIGEVPASAGGSPRPVQAREWRFPRDVAAWKALNQCRLEPRTDSMRIVSTGVDPFIGTDVSAPGGKMVLRFRARAERPGYGQVFWWTEDQPQPTGQRNEVFSLEEDNGRLREYAVRFTVKGQLLGLRLDPCGAPGWVDLESVTLAYEDDPGRNSATLAVPFTSAPSQPVTLHVRDEHGRPSMACFVVRDEQGRVYPAQAKRLEPDFFFHPQVYRADGEVLRLPTGIYTVRCSRGPESVPEVCTLQVGSRPAHFEYRVRRWIDPAARGWYSGDHHLHAAGCAHYVSPTEGVGPEAMARHCQGEDLKVGANLTWRPGFDHQKQFFTGKVDPHSRYPYLLRYDVEVSGFGSHQSGHLCLLRLKDQIYPGGTSKDHWPTLGLNTLRWAKRQGAVCGPAHSAIGLAPTRERVAGPDGPDGLPNFAIPAYDGIGANEFIMDVTHQVPGPTGALVPAVDFLSTMNTDRKSELNIWYHVLNCGFRPRISGETDFPCISGERVGLGRVYVKQHHRLSYDDWCEGIRTGRSYVSDGAHHLMDFRGSAVDAPKRWVEVGSGGSELRLARAGVVRLRVRAAARTEPGSSAPVELIVNGYPVARQFVPQDGQERELVFETRVERSSWLALRMFPGAHTNPIWVVLDGQPVRASRRSAAWCLRGVDQCWKQKEQTYAEGERDEARRAYEHARVTYRQILSETGPE
jgi:hypothetical protein